MKIIKHKENELGFPCIVFEPDNLPEKPAVIFQLHGAGERAFGGDDLDKVLIHGFPNVVTDENLKNCILVMPQCPPDSFWIAKTESLKAFMDKIIEQYDADLDRIYVCGLSMGGYGALKIALKENDFFAGGAALSPVTLLQNPLFVAVHSNVKGINNFDIRLFPGIHTAADNPHMSDFGHGNVQHLGCFKLELVCIVLRG